MTKHDIEKYRKKAKEDRDKHMRLKTGAKK